MAPFESLCTVSYSYSTILATLAVSTQYTNVTDAQPYTARQQEPRYAASLGLVALQKSENLCTARGRGQHEGARGTLHRRRYHLHQRMSWLRPVAVTVYLRQRV